MSFAARSFPAVMAVLAAALSSCAPLPESTGDLPPCAMLRRQICGADDECVSPSPSNPCEECKSRLCSYVRLLEENHQELQCAAEWRARPAYPVCRGPGPLPPPPTPPLVYPVYCESVCGVLPYPKPRNAP